jgi:enoyl-CoA hydratase
MNYSQIILDKKGPVATITFNRPEKLNAFSMKLSEEMADAVNNIKHDREIKILIFRGAGGNFSAGDDIDEFPHWGTSDQIFERGLFYQHTADEIESLGQMTIAAVEGYAVGGGLEVTMVCDFVIATEGSKFGIPEIDIGSTPGWGGTQRMGRFVGRRVIKEMIFLGILLDARQAKELQLVNKVVPEGSLDTAINDLVEVLLSKPHEILKIGKFIIRKGLEADLYTGLGFETIAGTLNLTTAAMKEGTSSFSQKSPLWKSRRKKVEEYYNKYPW